MNCRWMSIPFVFIFGIVSAGLLYPNYEGSNPTSDFDLNYGNDYYRSVYEVRCVKSDQFIGHCPWEQDDVFHGVWIVALLCKHDVDGFHGTVV